MLDNKNTIEKVVIAGGGTAGWMAAAAISKLIGRNLDIVLVESDDIPTVGVGEATIPSMHVLHDLLKINEAEFMAFTNATFKLGISFENWRDINKDYIHSFGYLGRDCWACGFQSFWIRGKQLGMVSDVGDYCPEHVAAREHRFAVLPKQDRNYAYHLDAGLYAKFLRKMAEENGVKRVEGKISNVNLNTSNGFIESINLEKGSIINGDIFIDCTGFRGMLIEQTLNTGFDDWSHLLICDSAIAVQTELQDAQPPYTRSIAHPSGWQWKIPLQSRVGNGIVYSSRYLTDEDAKQTLLGNIQGKTLNEPRVIKYRAGVRRKHWNKNCVAVGLSSGFIEPLESTSIHLIQQGIIRLLQLFPSKLMEESNRDLFNKKMQFELENIRDFIVLHYYVTEREDSPFWQYCKNMPIPQSLKDRINIFKESGYAEKLDGELFGEASWVQVMLGQGIEPSGYNPVVNMMPKEELDRFLGQIKQNARSYANNLPNHLEFIKQYCKAQD